MSIKNHFFIFCCFCVSLSIYGQVQHTMVHDSLLQKGFTTLRNQFFNANIPDSLAYNYADAYLQKAKQLQDEKKIIDGYYYKSLLKLGALKIKYVDSLIQYSIKRSDHYLLENALIVKAGDLYTKRQYKKALDVYIEAQKYAKVANNTQALFTIEYTIGVIYNLIGEYLKGLTILQQSLKNFKTLNVTDEWRRLNIVSSMVTSYRQLGMHDSVTHYISKAIKKTHAKPTYKRLYHVLVLKEGINSYQKQAYQKAVDSIQKAIPYFQEIGDDSNLSYAYFYLGKTYVATQNSAKAIAYFKKVDTIFSNVDYLFPETRATYEFLINHYKKKQNLNKQLMYIERLLRLDSILHDKELYLTKHISENYTTPRLLAAKQHVIQSMQKKERLYVISIMGTVVLVVIAIGFLMYQYMQRKVYKKRFEELLQAQKTSKQHAIIEVSDRKRSDLNIPEDIATAILKNLDDFKQKDEFLSPNITLHKLAKRFKTNHTYLSKIINVYEGKSFNAFVNDLRITYTINRLQNNAIFRKYTIDAIAEESGFSNTRTFSRAFQRRTNLNPSYFIKNLNASQSDI